MIDGPETEVGLELPVGTFYLTYEVIVVPCYFSSSVFTLVLRKYVPYSVSSGMLISTRYRSHLAAVAFLNFYVIISANRRVFLLKGSDFVLYLVVAFHPVFYMDGLTYFLQSCFEPLTELPVYGLPLQDLCRRVNLEITVIVLVLGYALERNVAFQAILDCDLRGILWGGIFCKRLVGYAEIVVSLFLYLLEVVPLFGDASVHDYKHFLIIAAFGMILC